MGTQSQALAKESRATGGIQLGGEFNLWVILALLCVYIIWGTTYLAIRYALVSYPAYLMMSIRFLVAGGILFVVMRPRGAALPSLLEWRNATLIGGLLLLGGMGSVALAEETVFSGLVATLVTVVPLWSLLMSMFWGARPAPFEWIGVALGIGGVAVLSLEGNLQANPGGILLILFATLCWSLGSVLGGRIKLPEGGMASAAEMLAGGLLLMGASLIRGERITTAPELSATLALLYLIIFGSVISITAYMYLLRTVRPALATSYAFINPVIALLLGVWIGGELIAGKAWIALGLILAGVACVMLSKGKQAPQPAGDPPE